MTEIRVVNFAIKNEADFIKKFEKWQKDNYPNQGIQAPRSMDELAMQDESVTF